MKHQIIPQSWRESLDELREDVGHTVDRWLHRLKPEHRDRAESDLDLIFWRGRWNGSGYDMRVDVEENKNTIVVRAELPGMRRQDLHVDLDDRFLRISGKKEIHREEQRGEAHVHECRYGMVSRVIPLPCEVNRDAISAKYEDGVLRITLPKSKSSQARQIEVG